MMKCGFKVGSRFPSQSGFAVPIKREKDFFGKKAPFLSSSFSFFPSRSILCPPSRRPAGNLFSPLSLFRYCTSSSSSFLFRAGKCPLQKSPLFFFFPLFCGSCIFSPPFFSFFLPRHPSILDTSNSQRKKTKNVFRTNSPHALPHITIKTNNV